MMIGFEADSGDVRRIRETFRRIGRSFPRRVQTSGLRAVARELKSQHRTRLISSKASPDGVPWEPWSDEYAKTRGPRHSLLIAERRLLNRLGVQPRGGDLLFGTPLDYPEAHQEGTGSLPQREWLGVAPDGVDELQSTLDRWADEEWSRDGLG